MLISDFRNTPMPAGLILIEEGSPPKAVNALFIAETLADPNPILLEKRTASSIFCPQTVKLREMPHANINSFFITVDLSASRRT